MGSKGGGSLLSGYLAANNSFSIIQLQRAEGGLGVIEGGGKPPPRPTHKNPIRQHDYGSVPFSSRWDKIRETDVHFRNKIQLGRAPCKIHLCDSPKGGSEHRGQLPWSKPNRPHGMVSESGSFSYTDRQMGHPSNRSVRLKRKCEGTNILLPKPTGQSLGAGCIHDTIELEPLLHISSIASGSQNNPEAQPRTYNSDPNSPLLAEEKLVSFSKKPLGRKPVASSTQEGSPSLGTNLTPQPKLSKLDSLDPEVQMLKSQGLSDRVLSTLKASRKVTYSINLKIWKRFCSWIGSPVPNSEPPNI
ncbi:uncharacterized protein LOC122943112 [Bufo gargarizans]|uniref:uncharacterized protein LOC122943112 n=1 Tax=Bufo gargarizans TaxID=30331 RepID=UPI001CF51CA1|nr:uncharacterized protein LOC122943112 [Bufo gargarizans]